MHVFTFHFAPASYATTLQAMIRPPTRATVPGLVYAECLTRMELGAPVVSPRRMQLGCLTMFAAWDHLEAVDAFLTSTRLGGVFAQGWHVRMHFLRRWGTVREFAALPERVAGGSPQAPVVAMTLARMRLTEVPRFIHWGKPVEEQVRDHPGKTIAIAAMRLPRTVATFSIWKSTQEMAAMVHGHSKTPQPERHSVAMKERERRDFHFEFTTLRFMPIAEYGSWEGQTNLIPGLKSPARSPA